MERVRLREPDCADCDVRVLVVVVRKRPDGGRRWWRKAVRTKIYAIDGPGVGGRGLIGRGHGHVVLAATVPVPAELRAGSHASVARQNDNGLCPVRHTVRHHYRRVHGGPVSVIPILRKHVQHQPGHRVRIQARRIVRQRLFHAENVVLGHILHDLVDCGFGGH